MGRVASELVWSLLGLGLLLCSWGCLASAELRAPPEKIGRPKRAAREGAGAEGVRPGPAAGTPGQGLLLKLLFSLATLQGGIRSP